MDEDEGLDTLKTVSKLYTQGKDLGMKGLISENGSDISSDCDGPHNCRFGPDSLEAGK